ncbi:MAG: FIST N-terminal domain-containing protein [Pseudomonadota bacterium]
MDVTVVTANTLTDLAQQLGEVRFDFVAAHGNIDALSDLTTLPGVAMLHGATSCLGAMTHAGPKAGIAAFAITDPKGAYGTALRPFDGDPFEAAMAGTREALSKADRVGEPPDLVWVSATPGTEEDVLAGIEAVVGRDVPIIGGSAADNSVAGDWFVFDQGAKTKEGVVVSVLFPSGPVSFAYQNGYSPSAHQGVVTRSSGRTIHEIDGQPALDVYSAWTEGVIGALARGNADKAILSDSTFWPLGREITQLGEVPFYLLAHPAVAHADGSIDLFATVETGEEITLMTGDADSLTSRAGRVANLARVAGGLDTGPVAGALMIYCGGCMLSVQDRLDEVVTGVNDALDGAPFLGAFTFGEQGALIKAGNRHGNLMISCIVFGQPNQ